MADWLQIFELALDVAATILSLMLIVLVNIGLKWLPARNQVVFFLSLFLLINITTLSLRVFSAELFYHLYILVLPCILLLGPLTTQFTLSILTMKKRPIADRKTYSLYATGLALIVPYLLVPASVLQLPSDQQPWLLIFGVNAFVLLFVLSSSFHFGRMIVRLYQGTLYSLKHSENLFRWLKGVWASMTLIWVTLLFNTITSIIEIPWEELSTSVAFFDVLTSVATIIALFCLTIFTALYCKKPMKKVEVKQNQMANKYEKSALSKEQAQKIIETLEKVMQEERYFLDSSLTVEKLAKIICSPPQYLSQAINQYRNMNFYELIANYRINYAKKLLLSEPEKSVIDVALTAGFNAKSTFNQTFKKVTGLTPSAFKKSEKS